MVLEIKYVLCSLIKYIIFHVFDEPDEVKLLILITCLSSISKLIISTDEFP